ncbi:MAG: TonB-dependent receptor [Bacteroidales bacterium]|nr:TonB-dependent receptor [Bacteroidales bacterium]
MISISAVAQSQGSNQTKTLYEVFQYIEDQTNYIVFYQNDQFDTGKEVTFNSGQTDVDNILALALRDMELSYKYVDNHIVIIPQPAVIESNQGFEIRGNVKDDSGETLIGVSISLKGTTTGTITDLDGNYVIEATDMNEVLVFSYVGYETIEEPINGRTEINITMHVSAVAMDEVVVIGYGTKKQGDLIGSISVIKSEELEGIPVPTIDQALQGKATGVKVTQFSGAPGGGVVVRIRGIGTINDNDPLYIVDGIPTKDAFNTLSPVDIESISILKDASAASIYGARAANGVILITTKKGGKGAPRFNYTTYTGVQSAVNLTEMTNRDQYVELYNEAAVADGRTIIDQAMVDTLPDTDWWEEIFRPAIITNHHLTVSGGSEATNYLISGNYFKQDGIILNSGYDRYSIKTSINTALSKKISIGTNINLARSTTDVVGNSGDGYMGNGGSVVRYAFFRTPIYPVYDNSGEYIDYYPMHASIFGDGYNPVGFAEKYDWARIDNRVFGNAFISWQVFDALTFKSDYGIDHNIIDEKRFNENWGYQGRINNPNSMTESSTFIDIQTWKNTLTFDKDFNEIHSLNILLGSELIRSNASGHSSSAQNFPDQIDNLRYLSNGTTNERVDGWQENWALFSLFGRVAYKYKDKYYAEVVVRRDGSSRFGSNNPYGVFPAASLGWRIDNEPFLADSKLISHLKLRLSAGQLGNQEIGNYSFASLIRSGVYYPFGNNIASGYYLQKHGNENLKWESQTQYDAGIDLGLLNNKIFIYLDYYNKLTNDMLVQAPLPPSSGSAEASFFNAGQVQNTGVEVEINYKHQLNKLKYSIGLVFSHFSNEVLELYGGNPIPAGRIDNGVYATLTEVGYPIGSFYLYEMEGIFQDETEIADHAFQGNNIQPGDVMFRDISGPDGGPDGIINSHDRKHVGSPFPDFTYGLTTTLNYLNWNFSFFIEGISGNEIYWQAAHDIEGFYRAFNLTSRVYDNRWTGPGTSNTQPRVSWSGSTNNKKPSTRFLFDGSYLRLKNINLGYTFNSSVIGKINAKTLKVYISVQNLLTFTKYPGLDPEMQTSDNAKTEGDLAVGIDWGTYPSARIFNIGLNIGF